MQPPASPVRVVEPPLTAALRARTQRIAKRGRSDEAAYRALYDRESTTLPAQLPAPSASKKARTKGKRGAAGRGPVSSFDEPLFKTVEDMARYVRLRQLHKESLKATERVPLASLPLPAGPPRPVAPAAMPVPSARSVVELRDLVASLEVATDAERVDRVWAERVRLRAAATATAALEASISHGHEAAHRMSRSGVVAPASL